MSPDLNREKQKWCFFAPHGTWCEGNFCQPPWDRGCDRWLRGTCCAENACPTTLTWEYVTRVCVCVCVCALRVCCVRTVACVCTRVVCVCVFELMVTASAQGSGYVVTRNFSYIATRCGNGKRGLKGRTWSQHCSASLNTSMDGALQRTVIDFVPKQTGFIQTHYHSCNKNPVVLRNAQRVRCRLTLKPRAICTDTK